MTDSPTSSRDAAYFNALYEANPDPWDFTTSAYEHQKYAATLTAIPDRRFTRALEVGCSIGVLTRLLAPRCASLLAIDIVDTALATAQSRCQDMSHVSFANLRVPDQWPSGQTFDLILFSEILYFLSAADNALVARQAISSLSPNGVIILVNYTDSIDEPCSGDEAATIFLASTSDKLSCIYQARLPRFRIDRLEHGN